MKCFLQIKESSLILVNREAIGITPSLSYLNVEKAHYEQIKFHWIKNCRTPMVRNDRIPVVTYSTLTNEDTFQSPVLTPIGSEMKDENAVKTENETETSNLTVPQVEISINTDVSSSSFEPPSTSFNAVNDQSVDSYETNDYYDSDNGGDTIENDGDKTLVTAMTIDDNNVDGCILDQEYATLVPITMTEARAVVEIYRLFGTGKHRCQTCNKAFFNENRMLIHSRMHDQV